MLTTDWRKSDAARILFDSPFVLIVCSHPLNQFPQELALRFAAPQVTEQHGDQTSIFNPDEDIANDLAALLTLLCRRLITVTTKVREIHSDPYSADDPFRDWPVAFVKSLNPVHWRHEPSVVAYGLQGPMAVTDYNPPPLGLDPVLLKSLLLSLPGVPFAESIVLSARRYAFALTLLKQDSDLAYQLLIAAVEATASKALSDYHPTDEQMVETKKSVLTMAQGFGLTEDQGRQLAIEACKGIPWANRKFVKFLVDHTDDTLWKEDDLFRVPASWLPSRDQYEKVLGEVYSARSKLTHGGRPFPPSSVVGTGPTIPTRAMASFDWREKPFPPVVWFERVVNIALTTFVKRAVS